MTKTRSCIFYAQGRCKNGDSCKWVHSDDPAAASPETPDVSRLSVSGGNNSYQAPLLANRLPTSCSAVPAYGDDRSELQKFVSSVSSTESPANILLGIEDHQSRDSRASIICRYYVWGSCQKGDGCPYAHPTEAQNGSATNEETMEPVNNATLKDDAL